MKSIKSAAILVGKTRVAITVILVAFVISSCADSCNPLVSPTEKALAALDRAIAALQTESGDWQQTLRSLADETQSTIGHEVSVTLDRAILAAGTKVDCIMEHLHDRIIQDLYVARAHLLGQAAPTIRPLFCFVNPTFVDVDPWLEGRTQALEFYGYDFDRGKIAIVIQRGNQYEDVTSYLDMPSHFLMTLNLGGTGVPYTSDSQRLILKWNEEELQSVTISQPQPQWPSCQDTLGVSEETGAALCASGFAMQGLTCYGEYCDNMVLTCCPYLPNSDGNAYTEWSYWISEENPNNFYSSSGFVNGVECNHDYCDNVRLSILHSSNLPNLGQCQQLPAVSEESWKQSQQCQNGWFVAGMTCMGEYCDDVSITCCRAK